MFLNRIRGCQALPLLWKFLVEYPTPQIAIKADVNKLAPSWVANYLIWENMLKMVGDCFCGEKDDTWMKESGFEPEDKALRLYIEWRRQQYELVNRASVDGHS
ncbi:hypothetical protein C2G38_2158511 [Gigaspora rosea]|uniref:Uncharacterized protein n=1 Tax=Gigaspora rosea TaxID=44941 RepID=A0A397W0D4_9GLOM|nr:hypothetical protein C2G38_2158511 [Gigaspora rosea]